VLVRTVGELRQAVAGVRRQGRTVGLVPTMGALHEGHLALVRRARAECDTVVVGAGVRPDAMLAQRAGIEVGDGV